MNQADIEERMLSGEPFTYGSLCRWRGDQAGNRYLSRDDDRLVDRTIQKLRRKGLIAFERVGGKVIWSPTTPNPEGGEK